MRYNPDTERGINLDDIAAQCRGAILRPYNHRIEDKDAPVRYNHRIQSGPTRVWDCTNGQGWILA